MNIVQMVFWFFVAILILVTVHEFGHFYVARRCGVKVLRFSVGFGKVLFSRRDKQGTEYAFSAIPLGGYVKMLDEREGPVPESEKHLAFNNKSVGQRIAVVLAGPAANLILAVLFFWLLLVVSGERGVAPIIGEVAPNSVAAAANLEVGQEVLSVDGVTTTSWQQVQKQLLRRLGESGQLSFTVRYPQSDLQYQSEVELNAWLRGAADPQPLAGLGITPYIPEVPAIAGQVLEGSPAERAGLQSDDKIIQAGNTPIGSAQDWIDYVKARPDQTFTVRIERGGQVQNLSMTPEQISENGEVFGRVGMGFAPYEWPDEFIRHWEYSVVGGFIAAVDRTWETSAFVLMSVKKLIFGEISTKNLSGAITIAKVAGSEAENGWRSFLRFLAALSVMLGVFNLLPIPVLDGGHLMYYLAELVKGKPVSEKVQVVGYQLGLVMVIGLTLLALYNDIMRL
ncbi:RIP metalloprotease RseP [Gilvimarinus agarilyticus]|uniref:RIP metalloprotease RseP n=1 Tax=unclassified Gilvimarinus TaxID=2642066 RepID=UPI001C08C62A|nr:MULTISPECIES: RIP metalloprotease RseP [unclassified Gilvimarinus]MBU2886978.1 RIP metalloprotease RseP [Gilvimarinus agarilyticus]MDO6571638.1 RIP metalloprotease RseP [Gilvimarinus sp. 2_MG-2023]MDO6745710.1 RIP metalloprotease RseP [Gilvimarinus sp. 1_MG-2023]